MAGVEGETMSGQRAEASLRPLFQTTLVTCSGCLHGACSDAQSKHHSASKEHLHGSMRIHLETICPYDHYKHAGLCDIRLQLRLVVLMSLLDYIEKT